jgi:hypothetical protein
MKYRLSSSLSNYVIIHALNLYLSILVELNDLELAIVNKYMFTNVHALYTCKMI